MLIMLTREIMGYLALAIVWVNTLLIAGAALKTLSALVAKRRLLRPRDAREPLGYALVRGRVVRGDGPGEALACHRVDQLGRSAGGAPRRRAILFSDRTFTGEVFGGAIELDGAPGEEAEITPAADGAEIWLPEAARREAAVCPSPEHFDAAYEDARKARGFARTVETRVGPGARVFLAGDVIRASGPLRVAPSRSLGLLISTLDPRALLAKKIALSIAAIIAIFAAAAGCTALALTRPYFGTASTIGGALCLLYFLLVQPAGTALRDAVRLPHVAFLRGEWTAPPGSARARPAPKPSKHDPSRREGADSPPPLSP